MRKAVCLLVIILFFGCFDRENIVDKKDLLGNDYRLFQNTPNWSLAKAVEDEHIDKIKDEILNKKVNINYREQRFGSNLLMIAIANNQYKVIETLLKLGANPNLKDKYKGANALIEAADNNDPRYLKLLLKYKGNPNSIEDAPTKVGDESRRTALNAAISNLDPSSITKVKLLVEAGADINYSNHKSNVNTDLPLADAITQEKMDVTLYLLQKGADYNQIMSIMIDEHKIYILEALRKCLFELDSDNHKKKMEVVDFLRGKGLDYSKQAVPEYILEDIKKRHLNNWKEYIAKY